MRSNKTESQLCHQLESIRISYNFINYIPSRLLILLLLSYSSIRAPPTSTQQWLFVNWQWVRIKVTPKKRRAPFMAYVQSKSGDLEHTLKYHPAPTYFYLQPSSHPPAFCFPLPFLDTVHWFSAPSKMFQFNPRPPPLHRESFTPTLWPHFVCVSSWVS